jgi:hypothetical protein
VTEVDGSPDGRPITKLVVSSGDLTISGRTATIDTSGSATTPGTPANAVQFNSDPAGTFSGSERLLFETGSNNAQIFIKSGSSAVQTEIRAVDGWGMQIGATDTDNSIRNQVVLFGENDGPDGILLIPNTGENVVLQTGGLTTSASDGDLVLSTYDDEDKAKITLEAGADGGVVIQTDNDGVTQLENTTTNADSVLSIMGNGTGDAKIDLQNASERVWILCDTNKKLKIQGGSGGNTFILDVSGAATGLTFPDGTTQTTAAGGGGGGYNLATESWTGSEGVMNSFSPAATYSRDIDIESFAEGIYLIPFLAPSSETVDAFTIQSWDSSTTGPLAGIYTANSDGTPNALQVSCQFGTSVAMETQTTLTGSLTLTAGDLYYLAFIQSEAANRFYTINTGIQGASVATFPQEDPTTGGALNNNRMVWFDAGITSLPATITVGNFTLVTSDFPNLQYRVS